MYRILVYNMAYGTGAPTSFSDNIFNISRYFMPTRRNLNKISRFINSQHADIIGLIEVDTGSFRSSSINQAARISKYLNKFCHVSTKYGDRLSGRLIPILRKQGNAILTKDSTSSGIYHYFPSGFKKLIIELALDEFRFFLLHLSLSKRVRGIQLKHIANLLASNKNRPVIIAGDFNTFSGTKELKAIQKELHLINPNVDNIPTFPSWEPKHQLDFILCSKDIKIKKFKIPDVKLSDHLPLILDFDIE
jgi:endonuclease/exonuclease/phosphatase family metal-dependent hydrolase